MYVVQTAADILVRYNDVIKTSNVRNNDTYYNAVTLLMELFLELNDAWCLQETCPIYLQQKLVMNISSYRNEYIIKIFIYMDDIDIDWWYWSHINN